jgi:iduronate 2-sulfatase
LWGKTSNFELDARVPLIIADPKYPAGHGQSTQALAELVDLYPTLTSLAGIAGDLHQGLEGLNLAPVIENPQNSVKDAAFTQHPHPFYGPRTNWQAEGYSIRTADWRYTEWRSIDTGEILAQELYDHVNDPDETQNVAATQPAIVRAHAARLAEQFEL